MTELQSFRSISDDDGEKSSPHSGVMNPGFQSDGVDESKFQNGVPEVEKGNGVYANITSESLTNANVNDKDDFEDIDDDDADDNCCARGIGKLQKDISNFVTHNSSILKLIFVIAFIAAYFVYFVFALLYEFGEEGSWRLLMATVVCSLFLIYRLVSQYIERGQTPEERAKPSCWDVFLEKLILFATRIHFMLILQVALVLGFIVYVAIEIGVDKPRNLISLCGMAFFIIFCYLFSHNPAKVRWRPVFWGLTLQIIFALLILRTDVGRETFKWLGDRITELLAYTDAGSKFVFGEETYSHHFFAFKVLPVVVFFSTIVSMLYYMGVMQAIIKQLGRFLSFCLDTSPTESINAAGNIFLGQTEAPLMIRPFLKDMTRSEIHAVMTGGFATIAGAVMAAYIQYKVSAQHLLSASVMSAPAALAISKLFYPETQKSKHKGKDVYNLAKGDEINFIEAASNGASMSIGLVANIAVNLIAFIALLDFVNATLVWFGDRVGYEGFTFQLICSYVFWPLAYIMGVDEGDCRRVGELIGTKTFLNEFVAYLALSDNIKNRIALNEYISNATQNITGNLTGIWERIDGDIYLQDTNRTLFHGVMSDRSVVISTYALCGFSNLSSMGVQLGALGTMAPERKGDMSRIVFRAMVAGNIACFMTACISGLFYEGAD